MFLTDNFLLSHSLDLLHNLRQMRCLLFVGIALALLLSAFICWMPVRTDDHSQVIHPTLPVTAVDVIDPTLPVRTEDTIDPTLPVRTDDHSQVIDSMPSKHAGPPQCNYTENEVRRVKLKGMFCVWPHFLVTFSTA